MFWLILILWRAGFVCFLVNHSIINSWKNRALLQDHKDIFVFFNIDVTRFGFHSGCKGSTNLCASVLKVVPPINCIFLHDFWSMGNLKSQYFHHEMTGKQLFGYAISGLNPVTSEFYVWCFVIHTKSVSPIFNTTSEMLFLMDTIFQILCLLLLKI